MTADFDKLPLWKQMEMLNRLRLIAAMVAVSEVAASVNESLSSVAVSVPCAECEHGRNCAVPHQCRLNFPPLLSTN